MSKMIEDAGARAHAVPAFVLELIASLEARIEALEPKRATPADEAPAPADEAQRRGADGRFSPPVVDDHDEA
jgi:hypothetical protein